MGKYFPKPESLGGNVYTSMFPKKVDLASLKLEMNNLGIGKLETTPVNLSKLNNVVKMKLLKRLKMMNSVKKLMLLRPLILVIWSKNWLWHKNWCIWEENYWSWPEQLVDYYTII